MESCKDRNGDTWEIYTTTAGWRWRRTAPNGKIVGASTEAYASAPTAYPTRSATA